MGMTLLQLLKKQPPYIKNHAESVRILQVQNRIAPKTKLPAVVAHAIDPHSGNSGHNCQIVSIESPTLRNPKSVKVGYVKVSCACSFFKFSCEYALAQHGAANVRHSNGEPASFTNPSNYPLLCIASGQLVQTENGYIPIESIKVGTLVESHNGLQKVLAKHQTGTDCEVIIIKSGNNYLKCTPEHLIYAIDLDGNCGWYQAKSLTTEHFVSSPDYAEPDSIFPTTAYAFFSKFIESGAGTSDKADTIKIPKNYQGSLFSAISHKNIKELFKLIFAHFDTTQIDWVFGKKFNKVDSIESCETTSDVYDIEVENSHCFYASGMLVHNCKHLYKFGLKVLNK